MILKIGLFLLPLISISAQSSIGLNSWMGISDESFASINSFEFNPSNYSVIKDWVFSITYGSELSSSISSNLYQISFARSFGQHFISARYSPGYQKEFIFKTGSTIVDTESTPINLKSSIKFKELFGAGYSFKFNNEISAGLNIRYYNQEFTKETVSAIFSDTLYFVQDTENDYSDYWKTDIGVVWKPNEKITLNLASVNLFIFKNEAINSGNKNNGLKINKYFFAGLNYCPIKSMGFNFLYETNKAFIAGFSNIFTVDVNKLGFSIAAFHDEQQNPFIAGVIPSAIYISKYFDVSLNWVKYLSDRKSVGSYSDFTNTGITNIINNRFSFDKILLTINFKLNTLIEPKVKFVDLKIKQNIFPALADKYIDAPVATARVLNLTNEKVDVRPTVLINGINEEKFQSPTISISANDTSEIDFYAFIPDSYVGVNPEITYANFYLITVNEYFDDEFQKAILVNGINAWDGNVHNLKYFIKRDIDFSVKYTKSILAKHKQEIDTLINATTDFYKAKIIFNSFLKGLTYTSDPRASAEYVQYPEQTLELKGGDCDDLSVCYSSLLESIGIETCIVDFKPINKMRHVNIMFNSKLSPQQARLITDNDSKYFIRKNIEGEDEVWIPIETTSLSDFDSAWSLAANKFQTEAIYNFGLIKGEVELIDVY